MTAALPRHPYGPAYTKLNELFPLKLAAQLPRARLKFERFIKAHDLVHDKHYFLVVVEGKPLTFTDRRGLLEGVRLRCQEIGKEVDQEIKAIRYHSATDMVVDENQVYHQLEGLHDRAGGLNLVMKAIAKQLSSTP